MREQDCIAVDVGNTRIKVGLFTGLEIIRVEFFDDANPFYLWLEKKMPIQRLIISDVRGTLDATKLPAKALFLGMDMPLPFPSDYLTPHTLGRDRVAGIAGARHLYPQQACMIIDAGTCTTYDLIDAQGRHLGGAISPGYEMRLKAMHHFTGKLPPVSAKQSHEMIGKSTESAMQSGAWKGFEAEILNYITWFQNLFPSGIILICGGNGKLFETKSQSSIFAVPNLVLIGLNAISLQHE
jgi:type III pantothenate kinase